MNAYKSTELAWLHNLDQPHIVGSQTIGPMFSHCAGTESAAKT